MNVLNRLKTLDLNIWLDIFLIYYFFILIMLDKKIQDFHAQLLDWNGSLSRSRLTNLNIKLNIFSLFGLFSNFLGELINVFTRTMWSLVSIRLCWEELEGPKVDDF